MTINDLYRNLFGRGGTTKGSDIDMAEHGRVGGISTGQPFKVTRDVEEKTLIDAVDSTQTYIGKSGHGLSTSSAVWQIKKILTSGTVTTISYADGNDNYDNVWDDRSSLTYS